MPFYNSTSLITTDKSKWRWRASSDIFEEGYRTDGV